MSLQTNIFEDGRWVTRNLDPYHARAQNSGRGESKTSSCSKTAAKAPSLGLLTRAIVGSSVVKQIIPARIRHKTKNDVLFISANSVGIMEAFGNYNLQDVTVVTDFDAPIRSAKVFGEPRQADNGDRYNRIRRDIAAEWANEGPFSEANDKINLDDPLLHIRELPPQILVLTLATSKLVFLCSLNGDSDRPKLLWSQHPLPAARWANEQLGEHLAVDPKSRAMAVSAHEGAFYVYNLKSIEVMTQEVQDGSGLYPIKEERMIPLDGTILKMEFLHPSPNDPGQIILLIIVCHKDKAKMFWYEWSSHTTLRESQMQANRYALPPEEQLPLVLVPLTQFTAFMMVCEAQVTIYTDILTGTPIRCVQSSLDLRRPEEPGSSKRLPLWTQWARPMRPKGHPETNVEDAIYLAREDGIVQYHEFRIKSAHMLDCTHQAGDLRTNIDAAFAVLDVGPNTGDLLVAGGISSEGGLWRMWPREEPEYLTNIPNWTPLRNLTAAHHCENPAKIGKGAEIGTSQSRLFACTGEGKHGTISELRFGSQASARLSTVIAGDILKSGILAVWAFHGFFGDPKSQFDGPESRNDATYVLMSFPMETSLLRVQLEPLPRYYTQQQLEQDPVFLVEEIEIDISTSTLYAATTVRGVLVLITRKSIIMCSISASKIKEELTEDVEMEDGISGRQECSTISRFDLPDSKAHIVAANVHHYDEASVLLLAVQVDDRSSLLVGHLSGEYIPGEEMYHVDSQPSCVLLHALGSELFAFVATTNSELLLFRIENRDLTSLLPTAYTFEGSFAICDSIAILESTGNKDDRPEYLVVCGLRNGSIQTLHWRMGSSSRTLSFCEEHAIGNTSVSVLADNNRKTRAILQCERSFCTFDFSRGAKFTATPIIENIWIANPDRPTLQQGTLSAFTQVTSSWLPGGLPGLSFGSLVCVDANQLHIVNLDNPTQPHLITRRLQTDGSSHKIAYSAHLKKLVVLSEKLIVTKARKTSRNPNLRGIRVPETSLTFLDPDRDTCVIPSGDADDMTQESQARNNKEVSLELKPTEHVVGMTEWFPSIGDNEHHLFVLNTKLKRHSKLAGRLLIFDVPKGAAENARMKLKSAVTLEAPVYSVVAHPDRRSIVYCSGNELCVRSLAPSPSGIKWQDAVKAVMRSPGRCLTVNEPYIYVSSARESLAVFKYTEEKLVYQYGDQAARDGLHHVLLPEHGLVLASDMMNTVVGLWQPPERRIDNVMTTVFEAILPSSINRLQQVARPVWYRDPKNPQEDQAIIGSSEDGTITQFDILTRGWRILRFVQNMAERNETVCPLRDLSSYKRHIDPLTTKPHHMHVNGDILQRVLDRGAEHLIKEMLDVEPDWERHTDFDSVKARWEKCKELAAEVVDTGGMDWLEKLVQWIRYRLRSAL